MLAGCIFAYMGLFVTCIASLLRFSSASLKARVPHMRFDGIEYCVAAWLTAIPGVVCLWVSTYATYQSINGSSETYYKCIELTASIIAILIMHLLGQLFDNIEFIGASAVATGLYGAFILGDMLVLLHLGEIDGTHPTSDLPLVVAGGVLCWLASISSMIGIYVYFRDSNYIFVSNRTHPTWVVMDVCSITTVESLALLKHSGSNSGGGGGGGGGATGGAGPTTESFSLVHQQEQTVEHMQVVVPGPEVVHEGVSIVTDQHGQPVLRLTDDTEQPMQPQQGQPQPPPSQPVSRALRNNHSKSIAKVHPNN